MPKYVPTCEKALLSALARLLTPATAEKAIKARISTYSTNPCADSSFQRRIKESRGVTDAILLLILIVLLLLVGLRFVPCF